MKGESPTWKTLNNYTIIMTKNNDKIRILWVWYFCLCWSRLLLKILKISFWAFSRKNWISLDLWALFSWKLCKAFRIARCKQCQLVKSCLNSDLYLIYKTSGTALLDIITSYKPSLSLSQENGKNLLPALLDTSTT